MVGDAEEPKNDRKMGRGKGGRGQKQEKLVALNLPMCAAILYPIILFFGRLPLLFGL